MPLPKGYLPRVGDEVLVRVRVKDKYIKDDDLYLEVVGREHHKFFLNAEHVHSLYRRQWNEGDKVTTENDFEGPGLVIHTHEEWVWVKVLTGESEGFLYTLEANELEPYVEPIETMTEKELLAGLEHLVPPPAPSGSQSVVDDDDEIEF